MNVLSLSGVKSMFPAIQWKIWTKNALLLWTGYKVDEFGPKWSGMYRHALDGVWLVVPDTIPLSSQLAVDWYYLPKQQGLVP